MTYLHHQHLIDRGLTPLKGKWHASDVQLMLLKHPRLISKTPFSVKKDIGYRAPSGATLLRSNINLMSGAPYLFCINFIIKKTNKKYLIKFKFKNNYPFKFRINNPIHLKHNLKATTQDKMTQLLLQL